MLKKFFKKENGAITLFVLLAMLFFLIVIFSVFVTSSNKEQSQVSDVDQIKQEYEQSVDNIDQTYNETVSENLFSLLQIGDYVSYDPTNGGEITTTYTSPQGTYHGNSTTTDTTENMTEGNRVYGKLCFSQKSCENCPIRKECGLRKKFYSEDFSEYLDEIFNARKEENLKNGVSVLEAELLEDMARIIIETKCDREKMSHPTYTTE